MSRSRAGMLPPLKSAEPDEAWLSPRADSRALQRIDYIEDRLVLQERTTQSLIDRAYRIKEDIIDNLNITHGSWQEEKKARELLQDHIRTITDVVRKLSKDIGFLENQIYTKQSMSEGTNVAVKNLEVSHVTQLADLRSRVARCDASIARLAADLKTCYESIRTLNQTQIESNSKLMDKIHHVDSKIGTIMTRLDKLGTEQDVQIRTLSSDSSQQMAVLDSKTRSMIEELKTSVKSYKVVEEGEREKLEAKLTGLIDRSRIHFDTSNEKLSRKIDDKVAGLLQTLNKFEEEMRHEQERNTAVQQSFENKLTGMVDTQLRRQADDISKLKRECREGFTTVHDSISNMKQVSDGKRTLLEEQLRKEIGQIRKMIVLI